MACPIRLNRENANLIPSFSIETQPWSQWISYQTPKVSTPRSEQVSCDSDIPLPLH